MLRAEREDFKLLKKFVKEQILGFEKVRYLSAKELGMMYLFGDYKKKLNNDEQKKLVSVSRQVSVILSDLMKIYPENITKVSHTAYKFKPIRKCNNENK